MTGCAQCHATEHELRIFSLGDLALCESCWHKINDFNIERGPPADWNTAKQVFINSRATPRNVRWSYGYADFRDGKSKRSSDNEYDNGWLAFRREQKP